jgi:tRNA A37 threonylcarbamoyladenosine dehydratase
VDSLKVVYSKEEAISPKISGITQPSGKAVAGSCAFVPSVAGLIIASEVVKDLVKN